MFEKKERESFINNILEKNGHDKEKVYLDSLKKTNKILENVLKLYYTKGNVEETTIQIDRKNELIYADKLVENNKLVIEKIK